MTVPPSVWGPMADIDHGLLSGLGDDDHPQYLTAARGNSRYVQIGSLPAPITNATALTYNAAQTGSVNRTIADRLQDSLHVKDFGAVGDGTTDDTAKIQAGINAAQATGRVITLRFDAKPYRIAGTLTLSGPVQLVGEGFFDFDSTRPITRPTKGTWLIHASTTGPLIQVVGNQGSGSSLQGVAIFEEGHPTPGAGWTPAVRDWVIRNEGTQGTFRLSHVHFHNVYQGVSTDNSHRPQYENITGQFFYRAFTFERIYDIGKLEGLHAWTYWSEQDDVLQWQQANCETISLGRVDGLWLDRIFSFATDKTLHAFASTYGAARVINVGSLYADFVRRAVVVSATSFPVLISIGNLFHLGQSWPVTSPALALSGGCAVGITAGSNHIVQVANLVGVLADASTIKVEGTANQVYASSASADQYDRSGSGQGAFYATSSNTVHIATTPTMSLYGGGIAYEAGNATAGRILLNTKQLYNLKARNRPLTVASASGELAVYTAEGEADAGVALVAGSTGVVNVGSASNQLSFYGAGAIARPTITGSRGGNVALTALLQNLNNLGLIIDSTTA